MKTIIFDGDSICQASSEAKHTVERGWPYRIGKKNDMCWRNFGIGGGTITAEMYSQVTGNPRHWISRSIDEIHKEFPSLNYLILEGGTNDADLLRDNPERIGSFTPSDYSGDYDDSTFCGAVEKLFFKAINYYPTAKIGFIIAPKMGVGDSYEIRSRRKFFDIIIEICKKWGIPYLDLWNGSPMNPNLKVYYDADLSLEENIAAGKAYVDGQHLSKVGYDIISPTIDAWIKTL
jgi:lysophospholipase L1-like esterase